MTLTPEQFKAKYGFLPPRASSTTAAPSAPTPAPQKPGFFRDAWEDIKQTGSSIADTFRQGERKVDDIDAAEGQGALRSGFQELGARAGTLSGAVGDAVIGIGKTILPQGAEDAVADTVEAVAKPLVQSAPIQAVIAKYESLDEKTKRDVDALIGIGSLTADLAGGIGLKKAGQEAAKVGLNATRSVATGVGKATAGAAVPTVSSVGKYTAGRLPKLLGIFSGENDDVIRFALRNPKVANLGIEQGDVALRQAVKEGAENSLKIRSAFVQAHSQAKKQVLGQYTKVVIPKNNVKGIFNDLLRENNVKVTKDGLDFSTSKIIANPGEIKKIEDAWRALDNWDKFTFDSLDEYKQLIGKLTRFADEAGVPSKSPFLGSLYNELNETVARKLPKDIATKYRTLNKNFSSNIELYDDIVDAFNSGDPFSKLANALGKNKDTLRQVLEFYEKKSGKPVLPIVAGRELGMEKTAAFGFLNPRSWVDLLLSPKAQGKVITGIGQTLPKIPD